METGLKERLSVRGVLPAGAGALAGPIDRALGLEGVRRAYAEALSRPTGTFPRRVLESLGVDSDLEAGALERIPRTGPVILAANHPMGGLDGLMLLDLARRVRPDVRIMANRVLAALPELRPEMIEVEVFRGGGAGNARALRRAAAWLRGGGCLATFPAGEVSSLRFRDGEVSDGPWSPSVAMLARVSGAAVVPVHFEGRNSWLFQALGLVHPALRTLLLPRELLRRRGARVAVRIGGAVSAERLARVGDDAAAAAYLRAGCYLMSGHAAPAHRGPEGAVLAEEMDGALLAAEVEALPAERTLAAAGGLRAVMARAEDIPNVLLEIGRLRERTFRAVGEGTGAERDLDGFDRTYRHLFVWDDARRRVIGAYRLGLTDELCADGRPEGLYTATLFRYRPEQMRLLVPGIELGRSFVRAEAQKGYAPLLLLWQGIGRFVAENPKYRLLFGTASISDTYPSLTRKLLVRFLTATCGPGEFARLAEPTSPPRFSRGRERETELACRTIGSVEEADALVASIDPHGRGIPVLLRQYLGLGARLIGFNVDAAFGNALDGLIVVDLTRAPRRLVSRYMGLARYEAYLRHHGVA